MEIIDTGSLRRIDHENTTDVRTNKIFQGIFGVGALLCLRLVDSVTQLDLRYGYRLHLVQ
jgi:hypothetical protein